MAPKEGIEMVSGQGRVPVLKAKGGGAKRRSRYASVRHEALLTDERVGAVGSYQGGGGGGKDESFAERKHMQTMPTGRIGLELRGGRESGASCRGKGGNTWRN